MSDNPLIGLYERAIIPFSDIRAEHVEPAVRAALEAARGALEAVKAEGSSPSWSLFERFEAATEPLGFLSGVLAHLESVRTTPEYREAYNRVKPEISAFFAQVSMDAEVYERLLPLQQTGGLAPEQERALTQTLDEFRRKGAGLPPEPKERLEKNARALAVETAAFGQSVLDATAEYAKYVEEEGRLDGLPASAKEQARQGALQAGKPGFKLTLHAPSYVPALTYLHDRGLREELYRAYNARASQEPSNGARIRTILELRREQAEVLGYDSFGDLVLEPRMAKTAGQARAFVQDLANRVRPAFEQETEDLKAFAARLHPGTKLEPWDIAYYAERLRQERYAFDEEELRPYFETSRVMTGLFDLVQKLFGVQVEPYDGLILWHEDVESFVIKEGDEVLGHFYVDLHPRDNKRGGAWMHGLRSGILDSEGGRLDRPHLGLFAANLSPSVDGRPALLTHREVETIFHEFGHLLHHLLSRVQVRSVAGTRVAWDFVELPSQIMENWCWSREALDLFARHHETDQPIPERLFSAMQKARTFRGASAMMRQLGFAEVDLSLHLDYDPRSEVEPADFSRQVLERFSPVEYYPGWGFIHGFTHLFSSPVAYASGYYSYKWAEVLDADAFTRFEKEGVLSSEVGRAFRSAILERGDAEAPEVLFESFMGRPPAPEALLRRAGLAPAA